MVKRKRLSSTPVSRSPSPDPKTKPASPQPKKASGGKTASKNMWNAERCELLMEFVFDTAAKHMDAAAVADELGVTKKQVQDQLSAKRPNLRKKTLELVRASKGAKE